NLSMTKLATTLMATALMLDEHPHQTAIPSPSLCEKLKAVRHRSHLKLRHGKNCAKRGGSVSVLISFVAFRTVRWRLVFVKHCWIPPSRRSAGANSARTTCLHKR